MKNIILCDDCEIEKVSEMCKEKNIGIEIQAFHKPKIYEDYPAIINDYKQYIQGIKHISMHAPYADLCPGSSDQMVRDVAKNRFEMAYKTAVELGISHIVFHIGWVPGAGVPKNWSNRFISFWNEFLEEKSDKMNYYIENLFDKDPEILFDVISGINRANVKACLDIGHAHCNSDISVEDWIKYLKDKIGYVHLHDNHGNEDEHLGFGQGNIPLIDILNLLNIYSPKAIWALECKTESLLTSLEFLKVNKFL